MKIRVLGAAGGTGRLTVRGTVAKAHPVVPWRHVFVLALAAFFVVGSLSNIFAPESIYQEYLKWGYPRWFHFVTGSLEFTTAVLLARASTRLLGSALGCTVMLGALATVTLHGEYGHAVPPLVVATLTIVVGWITWRKRFQARHTEATPPFEAAAALDGSDHGVLSTLRSVPYTRSISGECGSETSWRCRVAVSLGESSPFTLYG